MLRVRRHDCDLAEDRVPAIACPNQAAVAQRPLVAGEATEDVDLSGGADQHTRAMPVQRGALPRG